MTVLVLLCVAALAGLPGPFDSDPVDRTQLRLSGAPAPTCSVPLQGAVQLRSSPHHRLADPLRSWGTRWLVETVTEATRQARYRMPKADPIFIGDLSRKHGGPLYGHRQHRAGRDADIGLYRLGQKQPVHGFERVWPSQLDVEATWTLIEALLSSGRVEAILLDQRHIDRIVDWLRAEERLSEDAIATTFPPPRTPRLWERTGIVRSARNHTDHLHVRVRCEP